MKCFIHPNKESVATCKKCGKAMCVDCSSFSGHSGTCPACRKTDMDKEITFHNKEIAAKQRARRVALIFTVLTFFLIIPIIIYHSYSKRVNKEIVILREKIDNTQKSLSFVNEALRRGTGDLAKDTVNTPTANEGNDDAWQCSFCRTINHSGRTCKFCARKRS